MASLNRNIGQRGRVFALASSLFSGPNDIPHPHWDLSDFQYEDKESWTNDSPTLFCEILEKKVKQSPHKIALSWAEIDGKISQTFTYQELFRKSNAVASVLLNRWKIAPGDRVVLVFPPGLEFMVAFIGCLRAGVVAVPVYPPNPNDLKNDLPKLTRVVEDCGASHVLTDRRYNAVVKISGISFKWPGKFWHTTDDVNVPKHSDNTADLPPFPRGESLAFLQYTSGSTGDPKGVMVGHDSLAYHTLYIRKGMRMKPEDSFFSWLPQYHDLGLVVAYLSPLTAGASGIYLSPLDFIQKPSLWVTLMSKHKITHTAAPNFALDLTVRKFDPPRDSPRDSPLDLSTLSFLLNAAEPIRYSSVQSWNSTFSPHKWHPAAMCPSYGLAEHVVGVVGWGNKVVKVGKGSLEKTLVSSGDVRTFPAKYGKVLTVRPASCQVCEEGEEGEIWVLSQYLPRGYWGKKELSEETFRGQLANGDGNYYLRTGDLGFILSNQLFVTGRIKDLIIIRGKNYYPQDIERTVEESSPEIRAGCIAAFPLNLNNSEVESLGLVAELRSANHSAEFLEKISTEAKRAILKGHGIKVAILALIPPRTIPKTTSGKIRRRETKNRFLGGNLKILNKEKKLQFEDDFGIPDDPEFQEENEKNVKENVQNVKSKSEQKSLVEQVAEMLEVKVEELNSKDTLISLGLSSINAVELLELVEIRSGIFVPPEMLELFTVEDLQEVDKGKCISGILKEKEAEMEKNGLLIPREKEIVEVSPIAENSSISAL